MELALNTRPRVYKETPLKQKEKKKSGCAVKFHSVKLIDKKGILKKIKYKFLKRSKNQSAQS